MAQNAIGNSANIFLQGAQLNQQNNQRIFDAITNAANMYQQMQARKEANANALRMKQMEIDQASAQQAQKDARDPTLILAKAQQFGVQSLTPQERSYFAAAQQMDANKVSLDALGRPYHPQTAIDLNSIGGAPMASAVGPTIPQVQSESLSPVGQMLLPPPSGKGQPDMGMFKSTPSPMGRKDEKVLVAPFSVDPSVASSPAAQMGREAANTEVQKATAIEQAKGQIAFEQKKAEQATAKEEFQKALDDLYALNEKMDKAGLLKGSKSSTQANAGNLLAGVPIAGRVGETLVSPDNADLRAQYETVRASALQAYKKAAGVTGGEMNTPAEYENVMKALGTPTGFYQANKHGLESISKRYGTGGFSKQTEKDTPKETPKFTEGQTATNPKTGEKMVYRGGKWQPK